MTLFDTDPAIANKRESALPPVVRFLIDAGRAAPSADNSQPWLFRWGETLDVLYRPPEGIGKALLDANHPATLLAFGALCENMTQAAAAIGKSNLDVALRLDGDGPALTLQIEADLPVLPNLDSHPLFHRHTNRFPFRSENIPAASLEWIARQSVPPARCLVLHREDQIQAMQTLVRKASEVRFQTREIHEWFSRSLRFTPSEVSRGDGLDVRTLPLPPGGHYVLHFIKKWSRMAAINHLGAHQALARLESIPIREAPALVAIMAPPSQASVGEAGRLMARVWIELNRLGFAVQPFFVISDQLYRLRCGVVPTHLIQKVEEISVALRALLGGDDGEMLILLRVGRPKVNAPRSVRLPLSAVLAGSIE